MPSEVSDVIFVSWSKVIPVVMILLTNALNQLHVKDQRAQREWLCCFLFDALGVICMDRTHLQEVPLCCCKAQCGFGWDY